MSNPIYLSEARQYKRKVYFAGSTALRKGQGVCYDRDYGTAGNVDGRRDKNVEIPSTTNGRWFAGVTERAYNAVTGGQWIDIYEPGSVCEVAIGVDTVVNSTILGCVCTTGANGLYCGGRK